MNKSTFIAGDYNAICDVCGFQYKASELLRRWDGARVCEKDFEHRHPQELIRPPRQHRPVAWARPEQDLTYIDVTYWDERETGDAVNPDGSPMLNPDGTPAANPS